MRGMQIAFLWLTGFTFAYTAVVPHYFLPAFLISGHTVPILKYLPCLSAGGAVMLAVLSHRAWFAGRYLALFAAALVLFRAVSLIGTPAPLFGGAKLAYFTITGVGLAWACSVMLNARRDREVLFRVVGVTAGIVAVYGVVEYLLQHDPLFGVLYEQHNPYHRGAARVASSLGNPVALGGFLTLCGPICWSMWYRSTHRLARVALGTCAICVAVCLVLTFSRAAWISGVVSACLFYSLIWRRWPRRLIGRVILAATLAGMTGVVGARFAADLGLRDLVRRTERQFGDRISAALRPTETESFRMAQYRTAYGVALARPFKGVGFGQFTSRFDETKDPSTPPLWVSEARTTENMYLMVLCETGIPGLFLIMAGMIALGVYLARDKIRGAPHAAMTAGIGGLSVNMMMWDALNDPTLRIAFWMTVGVSMAIVSDRVDSSQGQAP